MTTEEFYSDAFKRGKSREEALAGAKEYQSQFGVFSDTKPFRPDEILKADPIAGMDDESKQQFQTVMDESDVAKSRVRAFFEARDGAKYDNDTLLSQRTRAMLGQNDDSEVDYVSTMKHLQATIAPYANMQKNNMNILHGIKGMASSFIDAASIIPEGASSIMDVYWKQQGAITPERKRFTTLENRKTGEENRFRMDDAEEVKEYKSLLEDADGKASDWHIKYTGFEETGGTEKEGFVNIQDKTAKGTSNVLGKLNPESFKESRKIMQEFSSRPLEGNFGEQAIQFLQQSATLTADMAPNLFASKANPMLGYTMMYSVERNSMEEQLINAGINKDIAAKHATAYASMSTPIEYVESAGRVASVFGKKKRIASAVSKTIRRKIAGKVGEAFKNILEENVQGEMERRVFNLAAAENNKLYGTKIGDRDFSWDDVKATSKASLQMSIFLEGIGVPVKYTQKRTDIKQNTGRMIEAGMQKIDAERYAKDISAASSQDELDAIILEIQGETEKIETGRIESELELHKQNESNRKNRVEKFNKDKGYDLEPVLQATMPTGENGTPLLAEDFKAIRENYTDEELLDILEENQEGEDRRGLMIDAINGDVSAQAEYNRICAEEQTIEQEETAEDATSEDKIPEESPAVKRELLDVAREIAHQEITPLVEDIEQKYIQSEIDNIINTMSLEEAKTAMKKIHEGYPEIPKTVDKFVFDAVNVRGDDIITEEQPAIETESKEALIKEQEELAEKTPAEKEHEKNRAYENFIPKETRATPEEAQESATQRGEEGPVFLKKAEIERIRESEQFKKLSPAEKMRWQTTLDNAKALGIDLRAIDLAQEIIRNPRAATPEEHAGMVLRTAQLMDEIDSKLIEIEQEISKGNLADALKSQLDVLYNNLDTLTRAGDLSGTQAALALNIRKLGVERETYDLASVQRRVVANKGSKLSKAELASVTKLVNEVEQWDKKAEQLILEIEKLSYDTAKNLANEVVVAEIDSIKGVRDLQNLKKDELKIKAELRQLGYQMNDITGVSVKGSELIAKLAINYIKQGANSLDDVVAQVKKVMPDASAKNVYNALSGRHKTTKKRIRTESAKRLTELKRQADIHSKIIDATNGIFTKKGVKRTSSLEVKKLLKQLRDLQASAENTELVDRKLKNINEAIGRVERDIQSSNFPPKKSKIPEDERVKEAKDNLKELRKLLRTNEELADLERRIKEKDFSGIFDPRTVTEVKSKELEEALLKKHQKKRELRNLMNSMRKKTTLDYVVGSADALRAVKATADMSYFLRQGLIPSLGHPILASKAFKEAFISFWNADYADKIDMNLKADEMQTQRDKYGLFLADIDESMNHGEEAFASEWVKKVPVLGKVSMASERNMVVGLNMLRSGLFDDFIKSNPEASEASKKAYAKYINVMTGRADVKGFTDSAISKAVIFSPKFTASRIMAIPVAAKTAINHKETRKEVARQWGAFISTGLSVLALAKMAGLDVGDNPDEPDFGKILIGDKVRIDVWGGMQQPVRLAIRLMKSPFDDKKVSPVDITMQFFKYKMSPIVTTVSELYTGRDWVTNQDISRAETLSTLAFPLIVESAIDGYKEDLDGRELGILLGSEFLGLGAQAYKKKMKKNKSSVWD